MKLTFGICHNGTIRMETMLSFLGILSYPLKNMELDIATIDCTYIHQGRERAVEKALAKEADYLFFLDTDMVVPADTVSRMLAYHKPVIGVNYASRRSPFKSTVKLLGLSEGEIPKDQLFECHAVGAGAMLINMDIFKSMKRPWFWFNYEPWTGEDVYFCEKARSLGFSIFCDSSIKVGHIGLTIYQ
jgi:hypothetical protein